MILLLYQYLFIIPAQADYAERERLKFSSGARHDINKRNINKRRITCRCRIEIIRTTSISSLNGENPSIITGTISYCDIAHVFKPLCISGCRGHYFLWLPTAFPQEILNAKWSLLSQTIFGRSHRDVRDGRAWLVSPFPRACRIRQPPLPIIGIVHACAIIHPIFLSHILLFDPIRKLPQQGIFW